jgi:hypothetical protein
MTAVDRTWAIAVQVVALVVAVWGSLRSGERPQVLIYAFVVEYLFRVAAIAWFAHALASRHRSVLSDLAPFVCRLPRAGERSAPLTRQHAGGAPAGAWTYVWVVLFLGALAFVLSHVNADKKLDVDGQMIGSDVMWGFALATTYLAQSLFTRALVVDPDASPPVNLGYNTRELTLLACAVLVAGVVVMIRQANGLPASGWVLFGPLIAIRFVYDVSTLFVASEPDVTRARASSEAGSGRRDRDRGRRRQTEERSW